MAVVGTALKVDNISGVRKLRRRKIISKLAWKCNNAMNPNIPTKIVGNGGWDLEAEEVEVKISGSWRVWFLIEGAWKQLEARVKPARPTRTRASRKSSVWIIARAPVRTNFRWTLAKQLAPLLRRCVEDVARTEGQDIRRGNDACREKRVNDADTGKKRCKRHTTWKRSRNEWNNFDQTVQQLKQS